MNSPNHPCNAWRIARAAWLALAILIFVALIPAAPVYLTQQMQICTANPSQCAQDGLMTAERLRQFQAAGISLQAWAAYNLASRLLLTGLFGLAALVIFLRKPADRMALFVAFFLLVFGANNGVFNALGLSNPAWWLPAQIMTAAAWVGFLLFFTLFPSGQFVPRWIVWVVIAFAAPLLAGIFFPGTPLNLGQGRPWLAMIYFPSMFAILLGAQVYRYRRVSTPVQRQQTKWVLYGISLMFVLLIGISLPMIFVPGYIESTFFFVLSGGLANYLILLLPLSLGIAMLRSRLWEIDRLLNRTLVYGALSLVVGAIYVLLVGGLSSLFDTRNSLWISLLVTGLIAVLFQPVRERLQHGVNRLLYGQRDEPYTVISQLSKRLESTLTSETVLPAIVETITQALKLPYAGILLNSEENLVLGAEAPAHTVGWKEDKTLVHFPVVFQGETLGQLVVHPRAVDEPLTEPEERLLVDLARQAGIAIHAARLTVDLQHAREQLVLAIEEERRRLRRDLHDGLGPSLANAVMLSETARDLYDTEPERAALLFDKSIAQTRQAIEDIRRLVYNLRPPALDELGLVGALREQIAGYAYTGIQFHFSAPEVLPPLPAAVEVAAYRITQEAVNNVVKHANAKECSISLQVNHQVEISICDNGTGLSTDHPLGVGLVSMRERAAELGGSFFILRQERGTNILVQLPM